MTDEQVPLAEVSAGLLYLIIALYGLYTGIEVVTIASLIGIAFITTTRSYTRSKYGR